jgi:uncharacterized alpha-E superfamily protein
VLRRIADRLFWSARYLERAEWRARLVDVNYHLLIESPPRNAEPWMALLAITGEREPFENRYRNANEQSVLSFFTFDTDNPSSIRSCINAARENARAIRHRISSELWLQVNTLYLDAQSWNADTIARAGVYSFFSDLKDRFYQIAGVSHGTLSRGLAYDFVQIGTMLERAENVTRLLDVKYHFLLPKIEEVGGPVDALQWAAVLRSASALEAYRMMYGNTIQVDRVAEFLLFDASFPRSVRFCLDRLEGSLNRVALLASKDASENCQDTAGLATLLNGTDAATILVSGLHDFLMLVQERCAEIGNAVFDKYLRFV